MSSMRNLGCTTLKTDTATLNGIDSSMLIIFLDSWIALKMPLHTVITGALSVAILADKRPKISLPMRVMLLVVSLAIRSLLLLEKLWNRQKIRHVRLEYS